MVISRIAGVGGNGDLGRYANRQNIDEIVISSFEDVG